MTDSRVLVPVADLDAAMAHYRDSGWRIDRISPADDPREVDMSAPGGRLRLRRDPAADPGFPDPAADLATVSENDDRVVIPELADELVVSRLAEATGFGAGRAGMGYRDLIPSRLGGRFIASHIRIDEAGPVPDYAHYHHIRFQMIFCRAGWVRVVYEDQGDPFVLEAGDCVLQPPLIRHQVLECSDGLEVIEIGCPAEHDTFAEHQFGLPTSKVERTRDFSGQRFVWHQAERAQWSAVEGVSTRDTGIGAATQGLADVRVQKLDGTGVANEPAPHRQQPGPRTAHAINLPHIHSELELGFVLAGSFDVATDDVGTAGAKTAVHVDAGDCFVLPPGSAARISPAADGSEVLRISVGDAR